MQGLSNDFLIIILSVISILLLSIVGWIIWKVFISKNIEHRLQHMFENKEYDKLIPIAKEALENNPVFFVPFYLAKALEEMDKKEQAIQYYQLSSSMIANDINMYQSILLRIGRLHLGLKNQEQALSFFLLVDKVDDNYFEAQYEVAVIYHNNRQFSKSHDVLKAILDIKPGLIDARFLYGKILFELSQYSFSLKQFDLLEKHDSKNPLVFYYKALNLDNTRMYNSAVKVMLRFLEFDNINRQTKEDAQIHLIKLYIKLKDIEEGIQAIKGILEEITTGPHVVDILYLHAYLLWNRGQEYDALKEYEKVYLIDPGYKDIQNIYDKYKKLFPRHALSQYFIVNETRFEQSCQKILGLNKQDLLYRSMNYYLFGREKSFSIFYRHIEPLSFTTLTAMEVLAASFDADLQFCEIYALGGASQDARGHALLKRAVLIDQDRFLRATARIKA